MKYLLMTLMIYIGLGTYGQNLNFTYYKLVKEADSLYKAKNFHSSAKKFRQAFEINPGKIKNNDRYNAACSYALSNLPDSAFLYLTELATKFNYFNYKQITNDTDLKILQDDIRWKSIIQQVEINKQIAESKLNRSLMIELDSIYTSDQKNRSLQNSIEQNGSKTQESLELQKQINLRDSLNVLKVTSIIDKYGWLGTETVGNRGNLTLFLIIQHSNLNIQEKYLPKLKEAVLSQKSPMSQLAYLEDRIRIDKGLKQLYGTQLIKDTLTDNWMLAPVEDEKNLNIRRLEIDLEPIEIYLKKYNITYNPK